MRKPVLTVVLVVLAVCAGGCLVIVSEERQDPGDVGPECSKTDETIHEIDAVAKMSFEADKHRAYKRIAARQTLSEPAQVHLVKEALDNLSFEAAKEDVLLTLIRNPGFASAAASAILKRLDKFPFESSKNKILDAINQRQAQVPTGVK